MLGDDGLIVKLEATGGVLGDNALICHERIFSMLICPLNSEQVRVVTSLIFTPVDIVGFLAETVLVVAANITPMTNITTVQMKITRESFFIFISSNPVDVAKVEEKPRLSSPFYSKKIVFKEFKHYLPRNLEISSIVLTEDDA